MLFGPVVSGSLRGAATAISALIVGAFTAASAHAADAALLSVELNKLETYDKGCRVYVVVNNTGTSAYQSVKLDLVLFQPDGIIARRLAIDLAPLKPTKKSVKLFDVEAIPCDRVASVLVNEVMDCKSESGAIPDCLTKIAFTSVAPAPLTIK